MEIYSQARAADVWYPLSYDNDGVNHVGADD